MGERQMSTSSRGRRYEGRADARDGRAFWERGVREREGHKNITAGCDEKSREEKESEKNEGRELREERDRVERVKTKGVAKQEKETRQRYRRF